MNLTELPIGTPGRLYRCPMPFSDLDRDRTTLDEIADAGIEVVVMLTTEEEAYRRSGKHLVAMYASVGVSTVALPIKGYESPRDRAALRETLLETRAMLASGKNVAVHCYAGLGRTGVFVALLVREILGLGGKEAIEWVDRFLPTAMTAEQVEFVRDHEE